MASTQWNISITDETNNGHNGHHFKVLPQISWLNNLNFKVKFKIQLKETHDIFPCPVFHCVCQNSHAGYSMLLWFDIWTGLWFWAEPTGLTFGLRAWIWAACLCWEILGDPLMLLPGLRVFGIPGQQWILARELRQRGAAPVGQGSSWQSSGAQDDVTAPALLSLCVFWDTEHWKMVKLTTAIHSLCRWNAVYTTLLVIMAHYVTYV